MTISAEIKTEFERLQNALKSGSRIVSLNDLTSIASRAFILAKLQAETDKTFVVVADSNKELENWECDLEFFKSRFQISDSKSNKAGILTLPSIESDVYAGISPHTETLEKRALTLWKLTQNQPDFVVASAKSLITKTVSPEEIGALGAILKLDEDFPPDILIEKLGASGYVREEPIKNIGEFSMRGGIIDVWSPDAENPVRIEFFGDTVDSIREFDAETQLSTKKSKQTSIAPMREFAANAQDFKDWAFFARERFADERFARNLKDRTDFADEGEDFSGWEFLIPLVKPRTSNIFDFLKNCVFIIDEPILVEKTLSEFYENLENRFAETDEHDEIGLAPDELFLAVEELRGNLDKKNRIELRALGKTAAQTDEQFQLVEQFGNSESENERQRTKDKGRNPLFLFPSAEKSVDIEIGSRSTRKFHGNVKEFANEIKSQNQKFRQQNFVMQTLGLAERLEEILRDYDVALPENSLFVGDLSSGFEIPALDLIVYTETDIFGEVTQHEYQKPKTKNQKPKSKIAAFVSDFRDLKAGDFVVHVDHGIGRFEGLQTISAQGSEREFMLLVYAENAKL
ncbi:MAG: CarD family transcriptional regulator, partial [Acidobacteriota bacterium]